MTNPFVRCRINAGRVVLVVFLMVCYAQIDANAQSSSQTSRAFIPSPQALAMGDAGVAFSSRETIFFYNPAHLSRVASARPRFTILGIRGALSGNLFDQLAFFEDELQPAINEGLDSTNSGEVRELYDTALALGRRQTTVSGDVLLPSVIATIGDVAVGAGAFGHSTLNYRFEDAGAGIPLVDFAAIGDLMFIGSASLDLRTVGIDGLSAGISAKMTQRWLTMKNKPLDAIGSNERMLLFKGSAVGFDVGLLYDVDFVPLPGDLTAGFAAYDLVGGRFDYTYDRSMGTKDEPGSQFIAEEEELVNVLYAVAPSYRFGAAYMLPGLLKNTGVTVDYLWYASPRISQAAPAHLHVGAQAQLGVAIVRAGLSSGYTTLGGGVDLGIIALDYAFYGVEEGRFPGQLPSWNHSAQLALRL